MKQDQTPLLGAEWKVEDIAGGGVNDNSPASLQFMADGKLAGNATCNRIVGSYSSQWAVLKIELLGLLAQVKSYAIDTTGALVLTTTDGNTILARR